MLTNCVRIIDNETVHLLSEYYNSILKDTCYESFYRSMNEHMEISEESEEEIEEEEEKENKKKRGG